MNPIRICAVLLLSLALSTVANGQFPPFLQLNGQVDTSTPIGSDLAITVFATPNVPLTIAFATDPGPATINGLTFPIGFNGFFYITHQSVIVPSSGIFYDTFALPNLPVYEGLTYYAVAVTADPVQPMGVGISNGVSGTFTLQPSAGPDTAGFVGDNIPLDGSGNRNPQTGALPLGTMNWSISAGPPGHQATLSNGQSEFPALVADMPGVYQVHCNITAGIAGAALFDESLVSVYDIDLNGHQHGEFNAGNNLSITADLVGPPASQFEAIGHQSTTGTQLSFSTTAGTPFTTLTFQVTSPTNQKISRGLTLVNNAGAPFNARPDLSFALHLKQPAIDDVEVVLEGILQGADLQSLVVGSPPVNIAYVPGIFGLTTFSADVQLVSISYDPAIDLQLTPQNGEAQAVITFANTQLVFDVTGEIFGIGYTEQATLNMSTAVGIIDTGVTVSNATYSTTTNGINVNLNGVSLNFNSSIITAFTSLFTSSIIPEIESAIETVVGDAFPSAFDEFLNEIPQSFDLSSVGVNASFDFIPNFVTFAPGGFSITMDAGAHANLVAPWAASLPAYYSTPSSIPAFGATVPGTGLSYSTGAVLADDAFNQAFASAIRSGSLDADFDGAFDIMGQVLDTNAGDMAFVFPGIGFEKFDPMTNVLMRLHFTVAPVVSVGAPTGELLEMEVSDLEVTLVAQAAPGHEVDVIRLGLTGTVGLNAALDLVQGSLELLPGTVNASAYLLNTMPGIDASPIALSLGFLLQSLIPGILSSIGSIPLPDLTGTGLGLSVVDIITQGEFLSLYIN